MTENRSGVTWEVVNYDRGGRRIKVTVQPGSETPVNNHKFPTEVRYDDDYEIERDVWEDGIKRTVRERVEKGKVYLRAAGTVHVVRNISDDRPLNFEKDELQGPSRPGTSSEGEPDD